MEWRDDGIVLSARRHGETSVILEVMTRGRGRHLGLVRGGRSRRLQPVLQPGNHLDLVWRARLDEHMGTFQPEALALNAARLIDSVTAIYALQTLSAHLRLLPERDPHPALYEALVVVIGLLDQPRWAAELLVRFELKLLDELGFGLDLGSCAATGTTEDLRYVSPKSGRAVSGAAGRPWHDKLFTLPAFLVGETSVRAGQDAIEAAYRLSGHFLRRDVYEPRGLAEPPTRPAFLGALRKALAAPIDGESAA